MTAVTRIRDAAQTMTTLCSHTYLVSRLDPHIWNHGDFQTVLFKNSESTWLPWSKFIIEPWHGISNNVVCANSKASDQPAHMRRLIRAFASRLNILSVMLLAEHHLEVSKPKRRLHRFVGV